MTNAPVLAEPAFDCLFKLAVDASDLGAGAVLLQDDADGTVHPVSYFSKKKKSLISAFTPPLKKTLKHFKVYVGSSVQTVVVYMDHNRLVFINQIRNTN